MGAVGRRGREEEGGGGEGGGGGERGKFDDCRIERERERGAEAGGREIK